MHRQKSRFNTTTPGINKAFAFAFAFSFTVVVSSLPRKRNSLSNAR